MNEPSKRRESDARRYTVVETRDGYAVYDTLTGATQSPWPQKTDAEIDACSQNATERVRRQR